MRSETAVQVSIRIMQAFVELRHYVSSQIAICSKTRRPLCRWTTGPAAQAEPIAKRGQFVTAASAVGELE